MNEHMIVIRRTLRGILLWFLSVLFQRKIWKKQSKKDESKLIVIRRNYLESFKRIFFSFWEIGWISQFDLNFIRFFFFFEDLLTFCSSFSLTSTSSSPPSASRARGNWDMRFFWTPDIFHLRGLAKEKEEKKRQKSFSFSFSFFFLFFFFFFSSRDCTLLQDLRSFTSTCVLFEVMCNSLFFFDLMGLGCLFVLLLLLLATLVVLVGLTTPHIGCEKK